MLKNPADLFKELELDPHGQIRELWDVQVEVLEHYYNSLKDLKRVAIELPTGSGKSIISLLILEMWRQAGKRVAILTSSIALSNDMKYRCDDLGIPSVVITGKRRDDQAATRERLRNIRTYKRKQAIGIMNYWAYMMGGDIASPDVLIIDDADSFENLLIDQYSLVISRKDDPDIYNQIFGELSRYRIYQSLRSFDLSPTYEDVQLIYFPHAFDIAQTVARLISAKGRSGVSEDLFWSFDRNKDRIHTCLLFISPREITFTPYIIAGSMHERMRNVPHIIYTSATLGTAETIHKKMGSFDEMYILSERDIKSRVGTMGKRLVFPLYEVSTAGTIDDSVLNAIDQIVGAFRKVLVLCNSHFDAYKVIEFLESAGQTVILYRGEADSTRFARLPEGVLVTAGRFIGLDLPGRACQVGVMPRMPYILGPVDIAVKNILEDLPYTDEKVGHRIAQAFGRCNRNPSDCAVYFMLDSHLAADVLGDEEIYQHFPMRMKAEIDFGQEFAEVGGLGKCIELGQQLLRGQLPQFENQIDERVEQVSEEPSYRIPKPYTNEVRGWYDLTERRSYLDAAECFTECIRYYKDLEISDSAKDRQIAWLHYIAATSYYLAYMFFGSDEYKGKAIENLESSIKHGFTSWFNGLQLVLNQLMQVTEEEEETVFNLEIQNFKEGLLRKWNAFYRANSFGKRDPFRAWNGMSSILLNGSHNAVCDALKQVLELMGFEVTDYRRMEGKPDLLVFANTGRRYLAIIEVKARDGAEAVKRDGVDQIGGHRTEYQRQYLDRPVYPLLFTNRQDFSATAINKAKGNVRLLRSMEFSRLMSKYIEIMEKGWDIEDPAERVAFMERVPTLDEFEVIFRQNEEPVVSIDQINAVL